jgi:UDP-N-acetylglucosamine/UDP-N-acetylgalactosamine diphosphorylase
MNSDPALSSSILALLEKGVRMPLPSAVDIDPTVRIERISGENVVFYPGTRISGETTLIAPRVRLGAEGPVTLSDCQLAPGVELKGGYFKGSVFLDKANMAAGAHVREGCLLEEESNGAHSVGLKQTILFPFVTLGSLINFCDCFMAGGTSRKNHSEVGSSYIHFNFTPNQDKATASLIGDVPRGVMLNQPPIFLGGQGGLVGPLRLGYGTVVLAGTVLRGDHPDGGKLLGQNRPAAYEMSFHQGFYADVKRRVRNNVIYVGNMLALKLWYRHARRPFMTRSEWGRAVFEGALGRLDLIVAERIERLRQLSEKMDLSIRIAEKTTSSPQRETLIRQAREFQEHWPVMEKALNAGQEEDMETEARGRFLQTFLEPKESGGDYLQAVRCLDHDVARLGTAWLQGVVDGLSRRALECLPSFLP